MKKQHVFLNSGISKSQPNPQKYHCTLKAPRATFGLSSPAHPHKGPRPQNSDKNKRAHTETAPATLRKCSPGDGAPRFRKALLVFLRPFLLSPPCCPWLNEHAEAPACWVFIVVKLTGHGLMARNIPAWRCSSALVGPWEHLERLGHPLFSPQGPGSPLS